MKIALVGLPNDKNLGDVVMLESVEKIVRKILDEEVQFVQVDLLASDVPKTNTFSNKLLRKIGKFCELFLNDITSQRVNIFRFTQFEKKSVENYILEVCEDCDFAIFVGGGLINFRTDRFANHFLTTIESLEILNIPILLNAMGVEQGYDESFPNCMLFKKALNNSNIIGISTRDNLDTLANYVEGTKDIQLVSDSACDAYNLLGIKKEHTHKIGIGVIRPGIFDTYKTSQWKDQYIKLMDELIEILMDRQIPFQLFTNGGLSDYQFAKSLIDKFNLDGNYLAKRPEKSEELIKTIASYEKVICSRLHATIIAYSADVPVIGVDWNGKLKSFGKQIYSQELFYYPDEISSVDLIQKLDKLEEYKWSDDEKDKYIKTEIDFLKKYLLEF